MRAPLVTLLAVLGLGAVGAAGWQLAREGPSAAREAPPVARERPAASEERACETDLLAAQERAAQRGVPVLALVAWEREHCPPAARLEDTLFAGAELARLAACCVPARLVVGPAHPDASRRLARYLDGTPLPALLVISPQGDLLHAQVGKLFGLYDPEGRPYGEDAPILTAAEICTLVATALERDRAEAARLAALRRAAEPASRLEAAEILLERRQPEQASALLLPLLETAAAPEHVGRLVRALRRVGADESSEQVLRRALREHPGAPDWRRWALRYHRALAQRGAPPPEDLPGLDALLAGLAQTPDPALEVRVRLEIAEAAERGQDRGTVAVQLHWFRDHSAVLEPEPEGASEVLAAWAGLAQREGEIDLALRWYRDLLARYPESPAAQWPKHGGLVRLERQAGVGREG